MRFMQIFKFAALTGVLATLPAAAQVTIVVNPSQVNFTTGQTTANVQIWAADTATSGTTFVPSYPMNGTEPWLILQAPNAADSTTPCSPCQAGTATNPANYTLRLIPSRVPQGTFTGSILIGGQGIRQNFTSITASVGGTGTSPIVPSPSGLTFTQSDVGPKTITLSTFGAVGVPTYSLGFQYATSSDWLIVNPTPNQGPVYNQQTITVQAYPANKAAGTYTANLTITRSGMTVPDATIPITMTIAQGLNTITTTPSSVSLSTAVPSASVSVTINPAIVVPYELHVTNPALVSAAGPASPISNGSTITITAVNPAATGSTTVRIVPLAGTGFTEYAIPVTLNGTATTKTLSVFPAQVSLSTSTPTTSLTITPSTGEAVPVQAILSQNLQNLANQGLFQIFGNTALIGPGSTTLSFVVPNPSVTPATQGTVTINPTTGLGFGAVNIPVYINTTGGGVPGTGSLTINPTSLSMEGAAGSSDSITRTLTVNSSDLFTPQFFSASASTTTGTGWLSVTPTFATTPTTLTVTASASGLQAGTYTGNIVLTPNTGIGTGFPINIPVTFTVGGGFTVSFNPTALTLTAPSSGQAIASPVQVTVASGTTNPTFTTSVTTDNSGTWLTATTNSSTLPATVTITANPAGLTPGQTYTGRVNILSGTTTVSSIPVALTVTAPASLQLSPATLSFAHQTTSTSNPPSQTVQINASGANVNWSAVTNSSGNWLQVSPATGSTPGSLNVSVNPTGLSAGTYTGTVQVSSSAASNSPQTVTVNLTVTTPVIPQVNSVTNAASFAPTVAVPGLIFTIRGTDLGSTTPAEAVVSGGAIDTTLGGVRVLFDGIPAPLLYASATQINGVMPYELYGRFSTRMQVEARNQRSREIELRVADSAPGIFTLSAGGSGQGAILNQNGSVNGPSNPAERGNIIVIYGTGHGQTNPPSVTGRVATQVATPLAIPVRVTIGGMDAQVLYAGPAPGLISGATQLNVRIPEDAPTGTVPVTFQVGGATSQANVSVSIR